MAGQKKYLYMYKCATHSSVTPTLSGTQYSLGGLRETDSGLRVSVWPPGRGFKHLYRNSTVHPPYFR